MFPNYGKSKYFIAVGAVILALAAGVSAQSRWLDTKPVPGWNERKRVILSTKRIPAAELKRCAVAVRQPALAQDFQLTRSGWTLTGPAQIYGRTTIVTAAGAFDGMCRPLKFETYVFVGNRLAGALSPGPMDSRTDGALVNARLTTEKTVTADYVRYKASDALCCPSRLSRVSFRIDPDGPNWLLKPEYVTESAYSVSETTENSGGAETSESLTGTVWRWESLQTPVEKVTVPNPERYTLELTADGKARVRADCNRGAGTYTVDGKAIKFNPFALTRAACPAGSLDTRFLKSLDGARTFFFRDGALYMDLFADSGTLRFVKANR